jgi:fructose-1,6-bisphosphatase/inositol monophosphatase family enzyme
MELWGAAARAVVEVGDGVAKLREPLAEAIARDREAAQYEADQFAHHRLIHLLSRDYPGVPIVSEEDALHADERPASYWLIDPIDGTASWSSGHDGFVCQAAFIDAGAVVFSAIHAPVLRTTFTAARGVGAFVDGVRLERIESPEAIDSELVVTDNYPEPRGVCRELVEWLGTDRYWESGSLGLKGALVAASRADLFIKDIVVRDWDVAPALLMMEEVGGFTSRVTGDEYLLSGPYEKPDGVVFARTAELGARVVEWLGRRS